MWYWSMGWMGCVRLWLPLLIRLRLTCWKKWLFFWDARRSRRRWLGSLRERRSRYLWIVVLWFCWLMRMFMGQSPGFSRMMWPGWSILSKRMRQSMMGFWGIGIRRSEWKFFGLRSWMWSTHISVRFSSGCLRPGVSENGRRRNLIWWKNWWISKPRHRLISGYTQRTCCRHYLSHCHLAQAFQSCCLYVGWRSPWCIGAGNGIFSGGPGARPPGIIPLINGSIKFCQLGWFCT